MVIFRFLDNLIFMSIPNSCLPLIARMGFQSQVLLLIQNLCSLKNSRTGKFASKIYPRKFFLFTKFLSARALLGTISSSVPWENMGGTTTTKSYTEKEFSTSQKRTREIKMKGTFVRRADIWAYTEWLLLKLETFQIDVLDTLKRHSKQRQSQQTDLKLQMLKTSWLKESLNWLILLW